MKKTLLFITLFITGVCFAQKYEGMEFYDNGEPKYIKTYKESKGKLELVKLVSWHRNGQKEAEGTFKDGKLDGKHTSWHENGQKRYEGNYKDGKEDGLWTYYTEIGNGKYKVMYTDGTYNMALFTDNLGTDYTGSPLVEGVPYQDDTYLYQKNDYKAYDKKEEYDFSHFPRFFGTFKDGELDGLVTEWYRNGQKKSEETYKDGKEIEGTEWHYYENGQKKEEVTYRIDKSRKGTDYALFTGWHENGQKRYEGTEKNNNYDGLWTYWYENGQKSSEGIYKDGEFDGLWIVWYENGQKNREETYKDGELISGKCWDEDGNEKECN